MVLAKGFQVVVAAEVLEMSVGDDEVGCEHGRGDFAAVGAVADEGVDQSWALGWLGFFDGAVSVVYVNEVGRKVERKGEWGGSRSVGSHTRVPMGRLRMDARLTNASCTAPQKHVAVASSSLDQPSSAQPDNGM